MRNTNLALLTALACGSFLVFGTGLILAMQALLVTPEEGKAQKNEDPQTAPAEKTDAFTLVGIGDSLTRGIGDEEGKGYFGRVNERLNQQWEQPITRVNLAVGGARTGDLLRQLEKDGVRYAVSRADLILMSIGANNLFPDWDKLGEVDVPTLQGDVSSFQSEMERILQTLRRLNPDAPVLWLGLYHPFENIAKLTEASDIIHRWNALSNQLASDYEDVFVIPTYDLFQNQTDRFLHTDHFHPNASGYSAIAERVFQQTIRQIEHESEMEANGT